jgi:hypothetical protein
MAFPDPVDRPRPPQSGGFQLTPSSASERAEFAVCDHWFCSHPGPTWPNRFVYLTGDLNRDSHGEPEVNTPNYADYTPSEATTLFDLLTARGVTWKYFEQRASTMRAYTKYTFDMVNVLEYSDSGKGFKTTCYNGLPQVTFIDPLFGDLPAGVNSPKTTTTRPRVSAARDLRDALSLQTPRGTAIPLLEELGVQAPNAPLLRTEGRAFVAPSSPDSFGSLLGAMALMLGLGGKQTPSEGV